VGSLPWQLSEFRLLKLKKGAKIPVEKWGPQGKTYDYKDPELLAWLSQGGNYGVMAGPEHVIIACDYEVIEKVVEDRLPPTFTVRSPRHKTKHFYYRIDKPLTRTITCIPGPEGDPVADIRHCNSFVVGPGSCLEGYGFYEVVDDLPLATITEEELIRALEGFIRTKPIQEDFEPVEGRGITFPITKLLEALGINNLDQVGNELAGPHPLHGSLSGRNFHVNVNKNVWHCFRAGHESGGGPLELLAVMMGLVKCEDCKKPSPLKTDKELFKKVLVEAKKLQLVEEDEEEPEKILEKTPPPPGGYISQREEEEAKRPISLADVKRILDKTIKHDDTNKQILFLTMLLNYCGDDQQNVLFNAPSSTGKSYITLEIAKLFPPQDVDKKGYVSPTSFFHVEGRLCTPDGKVLEDRLGYVQRKIKEWEEQNPPPEAPDTLDKSEDAVKARKAAREWRERRKIQIQKFKEEWNRLPKIYVVDLEKRILIFKDQPHDRVLQVLRSLLSHDDKVLEVDITDKTKEGGHRTKRIRVIGYPTVVFCSANFSLDEQERTRFWILSPDMSQEKLKESLRLQSEKLSNEPEFNSQIEADPDRLRLMWRIKLIKSANIKGVIIPKALSDDLYAEFVKGRDLNPRDQRDFPRLLTLVKAHALFQMFEREKTPEGYIVAQEEDIQEARRLLNGVLEANRMGLPPYVFKFYNECLRSIEGGISREEFGRLYYNMFKERLGDKAKKRLIELLSEAGLVEERPDPADKRKLLLYVVEKYIPHEGVEEICKNFPLSESKAEQGLTVVECNPHTPHSQPEACKDCQEFVKEYEICSLDGQPKSPGFWCSNFKPKPKKYRCKCGCGPWREYQFAREHLELCKDEPGHAIEEVFD